MKDRQSRKKVTCLQKLYTDKNESVDTFSGLFKKLDHFSYECFVYTNKMCYFTYLLIFFYIKLVFSTLVQKDQSAFLMGHWGLSFPPNCFNLSQTHSWALEEDVQGHGVHARTSICMTGMYQTYIIPVSTPTKVTGHGNAFDIVWSI